MAMVRSYCGHLRRPYLDSLAPNVILKGYPPVKDWLLGSSKLSTGGTQATSPSPSLINLLLVSHTKKMLAANRARSTLWLIFSCGEVLMFVEDVAAELMSRNYSRFLMVIIELDEEKG